MTWRRSAALPAILLATVVAGATLAGCGASDGGRATQCPQPTSHGSVPRVLVLGDSNLYESGEQVAGALSKAGFDPTLRGVPGYGLKDLDGFWLGELPALLRDDPEVVVVALGTNDTSAAADVEAFPSRLDRMMRALGDRPVVWVTHVDPRPFEVPGGAKAVNAAIRAAPARWPNLTVLDRAPVLTARPELLRDDDLHFTAEGMVSFADAIRDSAEDVLRVRTIACGTTRD